MRFAHKILKVINFFVREKDNYIYAVPHPNGKKDCYDLENCNADNVLKTINYFMTIKFSTSVHIYLECYDESRIQYLENYIQQNNKNDNLKIELLRSCLTYDNKYRKIKNIANHLRRFKCNLWLTATSSMMFDDKVRSQKLINMNYSTPLKMTPDVLDFSYIDYSYETSLLCASIHSALFRIRLENSYCIGFPRNDTFFSKQKTESVKRWVLNKSGLEYKHLLVYAPTYRDYPRAYRNSFLGFDISDSELEEYLEQNNIVMVAKYHPLQDSVQIGKMKRVIIYENSYDFSLYDLLAESDALITDYSSVMHDYLLSDKPIILNCFDEEMFDKTRGFSFEPVDTILPGIKIHNADEWYKAINTCVIDGCFNGNNENIKRMFHKYRDNNSTKRASEHIMSLLSHSSSNIESCISKR